MIQLPTRLGGPVAVALLLMVPTIVRAQSDIPGQPGMPRTFETAVRKVEANFEPATAKRGETVTWKLTVELAPGWHTYPVQAKPGDSPDQPYTKIQRPESKDVVFVGKLTEPATKTEQQPGLGELRVLEDEIVWQRPAVVNPEAKPGSKTVKVSVELLICDAKGCLPPKKWTVEAPLTISAAEPVTVEAQYAEEFNRGGAAEESRPLQVVQTQTQVTGIWSALGLGFLAGLILNVMPCVLPVVSLKIYGFVKQAGEDRRRVQLLGLTFGAGILVVFLLLGGLAALANIGQGQLFQKQWFLIAMIALMVAFTLGMFDVYVIQLPGFVSNLESATAQQEGLAGSFAKGMLATVLSTPCSGPFLGAVWSYSVTQPLPFTLAIFAAIGVGMAFPYVVLSLNPGWLRFMPRPGEWMNTFKQFMGFLMLGTAVWLLWVMRGNGELLFWTVTFCLFVGLGLWFYGRWSEPLASAAKRFAAPFVGAAIIGFGAYFSFGMDHGKLDWQPYSRSKHEALQAQGKTVIVDWTADW